MTSVSPAPIARFDSKSASVVGIRLHYWIGGDPTGQPVILWHGFLSTAYAWRDVAPALAKAGLAVLIPDMRGYGGSSAPVVSEAYALKEIADDMVELHDRLGASPAIWIGHDLGSPVVGALAAHHAKRCRGVVFLSVPYAPQAFVLPSLLPLVDRTLYPADQYPDGQWDYYRFYLTHFDQTVSDMEADISATLASMFRRGNPASAGKISPSALLTQNGGRYGSTHRAPATLPDATLWPADDFDAVVEAFRITGFRGANSWYLNGDANIAYSHAAPDGGRLSQPVLFLNSDWDAICDINRSRLGELMRSSCKDLSVTNMPAGHWLPLESKTEVVEAIRSWLNTKKL